jgi:lysophospholipid acyltransferase (LPLAT)-like uncharacterized protein
MAKADWKFKIILAIGPPVIAALLRVLRRMIRIEFLNDAFIYESHREGKPVIIVFWHEHFLLGAMVGIGLAKRGLRPAVLASRSNDGELLARTVQRLGVTPIRGSSSRGASAGLMGMEAHLRDGGCATLALDGPRGPRHEAKVGAALMARDTGAAIIPGVAHYGRRWRLRSWDRTVIPKPFSKTIVTFLEPIRVRPEADRDELHAVTRQLETVLLERGEPDS